MPRFRFTLRRIMAAVVVLALGLGNYAARMRAIRLQSYGFPPSQWATALWVVIATAIQVTIFSLAIVGVRAALRRRGAGGSGPPEPQ